MKLELAPTLSVPSPDEYPTELDRDATERGRASARLEPGYRLVEPRDPVGYSFYAFCNVPPARLWEVFEALVLGMAEPVRAIAGVKDEPPLVAAPAPKERALAILRVYKEELVNEGFLACGLLHQAPAVLEEVFIAPAKYLQVWGNDRDGFRRAMKAQGLAELPDLRRADEFPLVTRPLAEVRPGALPYQDLHDTLVERLRELEDG